MTSSATSPTAPLQAGSPVPDYELKGLDGRAYSTRTLRHNGLVLAVLFKTGCGTCQYSFPYIQRLHEQYAQRSGGRFHVLGISQDDAAETLRFVREHGNASFPILLDSELQATAQYGITHVPDLYLIGPDDTIREAVVGHFSTEGFNVLAQQIAAFMGVPYVPVVREEDQAPAIKPG